MKLYPAFAACAALALLLTACTDSPQDRRTRAQVLGGVGGAAAGSLIGSGTGQAVAIGAGAVLGSIAGGRIADGDL